MTEADQEREVAETIERVLRHRVGRKGGKFLMILQNFDYCTFLPTTAPAEHFLRLISSLRSQSYVCKWLNYYICFRKVTTCLENLEMSGILSAVREMSGILLKVREVSGKNLVRKKWPKTVYC